MSNLRYPKLLGLAMLTLVATSVLTAPGAQAGTFTAGAYPATVTGMKSFQHFFGTQISGLLFCDMSFDGELTADSEELTLTPIFSPTSLYLNTSCKIQEKPVHVDPNGCDFRMHAGEQIEEDTVEGTMDILCPEDSVIDFEITFSPVCHLTIPEQEGLQGPIGGPGISFKNGTESGVAGATLNLRGLHYTLDSGCPNAGTYEEGVYAAGFQLSADYEGEPTSFSVDG